MASLLRSQLGRVASLAQGVPKAAGQAANAAATGAPNLLTSATEAASTLPGQFENLAQGSFAGVKPGPGLKAAFEFAHIPVDPNVAGQWLTTATQNSLGSSVQSHVDSVNEVFSAIGIPVWIVRSTTADAQASVRVVQARERTKEPKQKGLTPRQFIQFMHEARRSGNLGGGLDKYVQTMIEDGEVRPLMNNPFEPKLYVDVARLMIFTWHHAFESLDSAAFWGHQLQVKTSPAVNLGSKGANTQTRVGEAQIGLIVDKMLESDVVNMSAIPDFIEKRIYVNSIRVIFQLLDDMMCGGGEEITCMGHALRFSLEKQPIDVLQRTLQENPARHCQIDEVVLDELTDELLADTEVNLQWMPDIVERQVYKGVLRMMIRVMEEIVCRVKMKMLGRDIDVRILGVADVEADEARTAKKKEAVLYFAEEDPLKTISSTELEERLKDIEEQRRVLEAIKELGGADFDLTAERPMIQRKSAYTASAEEGHEEVPGEKEDEPHEFQRLAHTLKLGRCLSVKVEVDADIVVPYTMIANLETYPSWMPWCTAGKTLSQVKELTADDHEAIHKGEVTFGIETGSFLGTLGDNVGYQVTVVPPGEEAEGAEAGPPVPGSPNFARVKADAVDGFAYGEKLVYDWRFKQVRPGLTKVELDVLYQARSVLYMPFWDSMQNMIIGKMMEAFKSRAEVLQSERGQANSKNE